MNPQLFNRALPAPTADLRPDALNAEGAPAYAFDARHALAQYAATGCLSDTFYASAALQLDTVLALCQGVPADFVARVALWSRQRGLLKDLPALLVALLTVEDAALADAVFDRVIDDGKQLANFVQVLRSGVVGRGSLASMPKRLVQRWFARRTDEQIFRASVGNSPSLADVIRLAHPRPETASRRALFGWLLGKPYDVAALPPVVRAFDAWRRDPHGLPPAVPFLMLTGIEQRTAAGDTAGSALGTQAWRHIARQATWQQLRMNLNTFARHRVFEDKGLTRELARKLSDATEVRRARALPYQLLMAWTAAGRPGPGGAAAGVPTALRDALERAMEVAIENVPALPGKVYVCCDVSGSMHSPVTGYRPGATSAVRCIDVAGLMSAAVLRKNPSAEVLPFEHQVVELHLRAKDSVLRNAQKLAAVGGGGTSCSAPLALLNRQAARGDWVIFVSDNESWCDARLGTETPMMAEWKIFRARNPKARLVCIDIQPNGTTQAHPTREVLNVGGFSDAVFQVIAGFAEGGPGGAAFVEAIEAVEV